MYKLKDEFIYMFVKRGDEVISPSKNKWNQVKNGMVYNYIDPRDWSTEVVMSDFQEHETACFEVPRSWKPHLQTAVEQYGSVDNVDNSFRRSKRFIDWAKVIPKAEKQFPDYGKYVLVHGKCVPVIEAHDWSMNLLKDTKNEQFIVDVKDVGQITIGNYTIGPAGANYANHVLAFAALGNLTGNLRFTLIGPVTEVASATMTENLGGFAFTITSNSNPRGSALRGHLVQVNHNNNLFNYQQEGPGTCIHEYYNIRRTIAGLAGGVAIFDFVGINAEYTHHIRNNVIDGQSLQGSHLVIRDNTPVIYIYSNNLFDVDDSHLWSSVANAANIYTNNSISGTSGVSGAVDMGGTVGTLRNNAIFTTTTDIVRQGACTGENNITGDATGANGYFLVGTGNKINQTPSRAFQSTNAAQGNFLDIKRGGVLDSAGIDSGIAERTRCIRGRPVPNSKGFTSMGAAEISFLPLASKISISTGISI